MSEHLTIERIKELREIHEEESWGEPHVLEVLDAYEATMQREAKMHQALKNIIRACNGPAYKDQTVHINRLADILDIACNVLDPSEY